MIISIGNQKGGVGKTTTAISIAAWMAQQDYRVLVVDLDPQGHCAESLAMSPGAGLYRLLVENEPLESVVVNARSNLDLITNDHTAERVKVFASQSDFRAYLLSMALEQVAGRYDLVILDMPPSTDTLHVSALVASDLLLVPAVMDHLALTGVMAIIRTARALSRFPNVVPPQLVGVLPTMYERTTRETVTNVNRLAETLGGHNIILPPIPRDTKIREASKFGRTIWEYAPTTQAAIGYENGSKIVNSAGHTGGYLHVAETLKALLEG